tara:strand:- start:861 stop:1271 length:411 start_codon:yes stop_codon:yes gene_type:complete
MKKTLILFSVILLAACSGTGMKSNILLQQINTKQTKVFVKRDTGYQGLAALVKVTLNGIKIGELGNGERVSADIKQDSGVLSAGFTGIASIASSSGSRQFSIKRGEKLFFIIKQDVNIASTKLSIYQTDQNEFFSD